MRRCLSAIVVLSAFLFLVAPVLAGGWATVRLDEPPGELPPGEPWQFGFMVLQHDVTPTSEVAPVVRAVHLESGDEVSATAEQEGPIGHFVAELTLPLAGEWSWTITPDPFAETSFPALIVSTQPAGDAAMGTARLIAGSCANPDDAINALAEIDVEPMAAFARPLLVARDATIDLPLQALTSAPHAIVVAHPDQASQLLACGEITGASDADEIAIPLQPTASASYAGLAVLRPTADGAAVTLYLFALDHPGGELTASGPTETIEMTDEGIFSPSRLEITPGTTVTWINTSPIVHSIALDDPRHTASGLLDPGQSFSVTFDTPGTFHYQCSPHPGMEGMVTVAG